MGNAIGKPIEAFICYASSDKAWYERLLGHLSILQQQGLLELKYTREIGMRAEWRQDIHPGMLSARLILLLLSQDFIASGYLSDSEIQQALTRHEHREARVVPILLRPILSPLRLRISLLPDAKKPVSRWKDTEKALQAITQMISQICQELQTPAQTVTAPAPLHTPSPQLPATISSPDQLPETIRLMRPNIPAETPIAQQHKTPYTGEKDVKPTMKTTGKVFVCYSHEDASWLKRLQVHLRPVEREGTLELWDDTKIRAGSLWEAEIERAIASATVIILLISADFLASEFISTYELPRILARAEDGGATILPVIVGPCLFIESGLDIFQTVNAPNRPLITMTTPEQELTLTNLAITIRKLLRASR